MTPQITLGAASLMGSLVVATAAVRWAVRPVTERGRHRREYGAAAAQDFAYCLPCGAEVPVTVHGDLLVCDNSHQIGGWA